MSKVKHKCHNCKNEVTDKENWAIDDDGYLCEKCNKAEDKIEGEIEKIKIVAIPAKDVKTKCVYHGEVGFTAYGKYGAMICEGCYRDIEQEVIGKWMNSQVFNIENHEQEAISQAKSNTIKEIEKKIEKMYKKKFDNGNSFMRGSKTYASTSYDLALDDIISELGEI